MADSIIDLLYDAVDEDTLKQYSAEQFVHDVNVYPEIGAGRGSRVREKTVEYPVPFDLKTAVLTPIGVFFSWDETHVPNGDDLTYHIWISHNERFPPDDLVTIDYLNETYLMYNDIGPGQYFWRVNAVSENGKRTYCLSYNSPLVIPEHPFDATIVTGTIEISTTWSIDHSPYSLPEGITIAPGAVLTIEPGVLIGIGEWQDIRIEGGLVANGTMTDSVRFVPLNPNRIWRSLDIVDPTHPIQFIYTVIDGGNYLIRSNGGTLDIYDSSLRRGQRAVETFNTNVHMERCKVENFTEEVVATRENTTIIRACHFSHGPWNLESADLVDFDDLESLEVNRCFFHVGFDDGIDLDRVRNARIINNRVENAGDIGISVGGWRCNTYIANNIITNCTKGIRSMSTSGVQLYNNVVAFCDTGLQVGPYEGSGHVYARNNVFWRNDHQIDILEDSELDIAYCMIRGDTLYPGEGNHCSNANFTDQWNNNFILREDSPLIDAGYGTGHPSTDYYEACRVDIPDRDNTGAGGIPYVDIGAFEYGSVGDVDENTPEQPVSYLIIENYPNPFNSLTRIEFNVIGLSGVKLDIFDITGRHIYERRLEHAGPGRHSILWGGRNNDGLRLASGLYICRVSQTAGVKSIKMVMVK